MGSPPKISSPSADQEIGQAEGRHEQDDVGLVDQRPQHERARCAKASASITPMVSASATNGRHAVLVEADQRQRREHHHDALREIEHAGGLEDQHEAERDQRIEHAGDQALPQRLREQIGRRCPSARRDR